MLEDLLNSEGLKAVELYRKSFTDNDRVATGKTNQSVAYEVVKTDVSITLSVYGRKDIGQLETGVNAAQYNSNPASFGDIDEWVDARQQRGDSVPPANSVLAMLSERGWNTKLPNRTNPNGGTKDIITTPTNQILQSLESKVTAASKDFVLKQINITV